MENTEWDVLSGTSVIRDAVFLSVEPKQNSAEVSKQCSVMDGWRKKGLGQVINLLLLIYLAFSYGNTFKGASIKDHIYFWPNGFHF